MWNMPPKENGRETYDLIEDEQFDRTLEYIFIHLVPKLSSTILIIITTSTRAERLQENGQGKNRNLKSRSHYNNSAATSNYCSKYKKIPINRMALH